MNKVLRKKIKLLPNSTSKIDYYEIPIIDAKDYQNRIDTALKMVDKSLTHILVYGDREHFSNIEYFTGYDPRFEEALLILSFDRKPVIIVGNEGCAYAKKVPYDIEILVYTPFSLPKQPQNLDVTLERILRSAGITNQSRIGIIGWKLFDFDHISQFDIPYFIMYSILDIVGESQVFNYTPLMIDAQKGLRHNLDVKELVLCEISGTKTSRSVYQVLQNLEEGISELEASSYFRIDGDPLAIHQVVNYGDNIFYAVASPTANTRLHRGDLVGVGMSYRRSLCHKASYFVNDASELNKQTEVIYDKYFRAVSTWYESIGNGISGSKVYNSLTEVIGNPSDFGISLNIGHLIHTEEWTSSPFYKGSLDMLHSGMAIQCDFMTSFQDLGVAVHAEDGIILADEAMRVEIKRIAPKSYLRMMNRREFMINVLGIKIAPEVMPVSDMPAIVFPYLCDLSTILVNS